MSARGGGGHDDRGRGGGGNRGGRAGGGAGGSQGRHKGGGGYKGGGGHGGGGGGGYGGGGGGGYGGGGGGGGYGGGGGGGGGGPTVFRDPNNPSPIPDAQSLAVETAYAKNVGSLAGAVAKNPLANQMPPRPAFGTMGMKIAVYANYFKIKVPPKLSLTRYNVEVTPAVVGKKLARVFQLLLELPEFTGLATEWKSMIISPRILAIPDGFTVQIPYKAEGQDEPLERAITYTVRVVTPLTFSVSGLCSYLATANADHDFAQKAEIIQVMNAVFGSHPQSHDGMTSVGPSRHYSLDRSQANANNIAALGGGLEALRGYFQSVRPATGGLLLNVNVTHGVFLEPVRLDFLYVKLGTGNITGIHRKLKFIRVEQIHLPVKKNKKGQTVPRIKTIFGLAHPNDGRRDEHPPQIDGHGAGPKGVKFWLSADGPPAAAGANAVPPGKGKKASGPKPGPKLPTNQYISVFTYFQKKYPQIQLNDRNPVVNVGTMDKPSYIPAEACVVQPGQVINRRLSPDQTKEMIKFACRKPAENAKSIVGGGRAALGLNSNTNSVARSLGLEVANNLLTVSARVLAPPQIRYGEKGQSKSVLPKDGSWNMIKVQFHTGGNLGRWTYIHFRSNRGRDYSKEIPGHVQNFKAFLIKSGINANGLVTIPAPPTINLMDGQEVRNHEQISYIFGCMEKSPSRPNFVLCILPFSDVAIYNSIKTIADSKVGIHTVCVKAENFVKTMRQEQYFGNVSLKFNLKAGGINQTLDSAKLGIISEGKTMVVGLDVTHPSPGSDPSAPSVAGIVCSVDKWLGQWPSDFLVQDPRKEMVTGLEKLMMSRLDVWRKKNPQLPENILIYRDGVSEGQYSQVLEDELPLIRNACRQKYPATVTKQGLPRISIIICGKRHHTRFYPVSEETASKTSNCQPGTVVDRGVTEARNWDFYLQAHQCLQGTARSAHYYVVLDEIFRFSKQKTNITAADALEDLTHNMSHLFGRATKTVSLCPPAYYADLLCTRLRCYLSEHFDPRESSATPSVASGAPAIPVIPATPTLPERIRDSMFYI